MEVQEDKILETPVENIEPPDNNDPIIMPREDFLITTDKHSKVELSRRSSKGRPKERRKHSSTPRSAVIDTAIDEQQTDSEPPTRSKRNSVSRDITADAAIDEPEVNPALFTKPKSSSKRKLDIQPSDISLSRRRAADSEKTTLTRPTAILLSPSKTKTDRENEQPPCSPQKDRRETLGTISTRALKPSMILSSPVSRI